MGRTRGLDSRTAAMVAGELLLIQRYLVHLPVELSHARGKASPTARLAVRASLAVDSLRSQLENRLARDRRRAPSPGRPLSALSAQGYHCRKDIVVGDDNKSLPEGPRRCIRAASRPGDVVLDPFAGAGTTGLAASELNHDCVLLDISADYVHLMKERLCRPLVAQIEAWGLSLRINARQQRLPMQCWVLKTHHATVAATSPAVGWPVPLKFDAKRMRAVSASELAHACSCCFDAAIVRVG